MRMRQYRATEKTRAYRRRKLGYFLHQKVLFSSFIPRRHIFSHMGRGIRRHLLAGFSETKHSMHESLLPPYLLIFLWERCGIGYRKVLLPHAVTYYHFSKRIHVCSLTLLNPRTRIIKTILVRTRAAYHRSHCQKVEELFAASVKNLPPIRSLVRDL